MMTLDQVLPTLPQMQIPGGMFGGSKLQNALMAAASGFTARRNPGLSESLMRPLMLRQQMQMQAQMQGVEFQRQLALAQAQAQLKMQYPDSPLAQSLYQAGIMPGTPEWTKAMQQDVALKQNPVVNAGPYGPVLYNQVAGAANAKPLTDADIARMDGGQTPPASGGFPNGPYPNIGPYKRY